MQIAAQIKYISKVIEEDIKEKCKDIKRECCVIFRCKDNSFSFSGNNLYCTKLLIKKHMRIKNIYAKEEILLMMDNAMD